MKCVVLKCQFHILTNRVDIIYICWGIYIIIIFHKITVTYALFGHNMFILIKFFSSIIHAAHARKNMVYPFVG